MPEDSEKYLLDDKMLAILQQELIENDAQFVVIEGAGGVASPTIQGQLQCDIYRKIRLPIILLGIVVMVFQLQLVL